MNNRVREVLANLDPQALSEGPWVRLSLNVPTAALEEVAAAIAWAVGEAENLTPAEVGWLEKEIGATFRAQYEQLVGIGEEFSAGAAAWEPRFFWSTPFLKEATRRELEALAAARGLSPEALELEVVRRGLAALQSDT